MISKKKKATQDDLLTLQFDKDSKKTKADQTKNQKRSVQKPVKKEIEQTKQRLPTQETKADPSTISQSSSVNPSSKHSQPSQSNQSSARLKEKVEKPKTVEEDAKDKRLREMEQIIVEMSKKLDEKDKIIEESAK